MTSVNSRCLPMMAAGGERGTIESPEWARFGFSYLAVIGIFPRSIALRKASLGSLLTHYGKQKDLICPRAGSRRYSPHQFIHHVPLARIILCNRRRNE